MLLGSRENANAGVSSGSFLFLAPVKISVFSSLLRQSPSLLLSPFSLSFVFSAPMASTFLSLLWSVEALSSSSSIPCFDLAFSSLVRRMGVNRMVQRRFRDSRYCLWLRWLMV